MHLTECPFGNQRFPLSVEDSEEAVRTELLDQLTGSVQWESTIHFLTGQKVDTFIEFGPGNVLSGTIKRTNRNTKRINIGTVEEVKAFAEQLRSNTL